jgi:hypothetical protein
MPDEKVPPDLGQPLVLKKGEVYVLETDRRLSAGEVEMITQHWTGLVGAPPIILTGGLHVARRRDVTVTVDNSLEGEHG